MLPGEMHRHASPRPMHSARRSQFAKPRRRAQAKIQALASENAALRAALAEVKAEPAARRGELERLSRSADPSPVSVLEQTAASQQQQLQGQEEQRETLRMRQLVGTQQRLGPRQAGLPPADDADQSLQLPALVSLSCVVLCSA